jgi:colanic acid biosynthesis protein WcaH
MDIPNNLYKKIVDVLPILCVDIVIKHKGEFLLVKRNNKPMKGKFWVPGGRVLKTEKIEQAVKRKVKEETGLKVKIIRPLGYFEGDFLKNEFGSKTGYHGVSIVFLTKPISFKVKLDSQSSDWKFSKNLPKLFKIKPFN